MAITTADKVIDRWIWAAGNGDEEELKRGVAQAVQDAVMAERIACIHIADEMQRMAENPHNRSKTNQRQNMRLRSEARMAKSIKEKIIDRTPFSQRTPELITGK